MAAVAVSLWGFAAVSLSEKKNVRNAEAAAEAAAEAVAEAAAAAAAAAAVDAIRIEPSMPPTAAPCASPPIHRTDELEVGKALAAGGIMVRDIPTTRPMFPQFHAC